jgi:hypothetical protein
MDLKVYQEKLTLKHRPSIKLIKDISTNNIKPIKETFFLPIFSKVFPTTGDARRHPTSVKLKWLRSYQYYENMRPIIYSSIAPLYLFVTYVGSTASAQRIRVLIDNSANKAAIMIRRLIALFSGVKLYSTSSFSSIYFC